MKQKLIKSAIIIASFFVISFVLAQFLSLMDSDIFFATCAIGIFISFLILIVFVCVKKWRTFWLYPLSLMIGLCLTFYIVNSGNFYIYSKNITKIAEKEVLVYLEDPYYTFGMFSEENHNLPYDLKVHSCAEVNVVSSKMDSVVNATSYVTVILENKKNAEQYKLSVEISGSKNQYRQVKPHNILDIDYNQKYFRILKYLADGENRLVDEFILTTSKETMDKYLTSCVFKHIYSTCIKSIDFSNDIVHYFIVSPKYDLHNPKIVVANLKDLRQFYAEDVTRVIRKDKLQIITTTNPVEYNDIYAFITFDDIHNIDFVYDYLLDFLSLSPNKSNSICENLNDISLDYRYSSQHDFLELKYSYDPQANADILESMINNFLHYCEYDYANNPQSQLEKLNDIYNIFGM